MPPPIYGCQADDRMTNQGNVVRGNPRIKAFLIFVTVITMVFATIALSSEIGADNETYDQQITYHYDSSPNSQSVTVGYNGIAATEYNPECWEGTFKAVNDAEYSDWTGPSSYSITVEETPTVTFIADSGVKNRPYTIIFPDTHFIATVTAVSDNISQENIVIAADKHSVTYQQNDNSRTTIQITFSQPITVTPNKVFAGWMNGNELIMPGDVVDRSVTDLTAKWITPDVFILEQDWINWNFNTRQSGNQTEMVLSTQIEAVSAYANLGFTLTDTGAKDGRIGILECNTDGTIKTEGYRDYPVKYSRVIYGDDRTGPDMFGTIYHLTAERTYVKIFFCNVGTLTDCYPTVFSPGTYRTPLDYTNSTLPAMKFSGTGAVVARMGGNTVIDNIVIAGDTVPVHGDSTNSAIVADGHILIMGTGITDLSYTVDNNRVKGAPEIFGGTNGNISTGGYNKNITQAVATKKIVYGDGREGEVKNLGTFVIVHSGVYANLVAGSFGRCDIGTANQPLSTYMVLKGGSTYDTVAGGNGGEGGTIYGGSGSGFENDGGTYVYLIGHFMSGDDWEDKESGCYGEEFERNRYNAVQSSILEGGHSKGKSLSTQGIVKGSTHVFLTGTASVWDVQAGGRSGYTHADTTYLEITGNAVVRHVACGTITDGASSDNNCVDNIRMYIGGDTVVANVYGAGYDTTYYPTGKSMKEGSIRVVIEGGKIGNVFGGGYRGSIGNENNPNGLNIDIEISGGTVFGNVYGGGSGGLDKIRHNADGTFNSSTISAYDSSMGRSYVHGNTNVTVTGDAEVKGNVYGGGMSVPKLATYSAGSKNITTFSDEEVNDKQINVATVSGNTSVTISGDAQIGGSVFGGGKGVDAEFVNYGWTIADCTRSTVVKVDATGDNPFIELPWYVNPNADISSKTAYSYTYDMSDKYLKTTGSKITGGSYADYSKVVRNASVFIEGGVIAGSVYGGGAFGKVGGASFVEVSGGTIEGSVFGGGLGTEGIVAVTGSRTVYITGSSKVKGSVYGSSSKGDDGPKDTFHISTTPGDLISESYSDSTVIIEQAEISGSVFGGGFLGNTWGNTYVYMGYKISKNQDGSYSAPYYVEDQAVRTISVSSIYAGGNVSTDVDDQNIQTVQAPFSQDLVQGHGSIYIYGHGATGDIHISGSIMGSGNACNTALSTYVEINNLQNRSQMTGIHRATTVWIVQSDLDISGRSNTDNKTLSLYKIENLTIKYDTSLSIEYPADGIESFQSLNRDNNPTTFGSPSNTLTYTGGSTVYIRDADTGEFGTVTGFTLISIQNQASYGAYLLCRSDSPGGFVVSKDGAFKIADSTVFENNVTCWFIGGVEKKVVTTTIKASEGIRAMKVSDTVSVDIVKMSNGTYIQYIGGSFTPGSTATASDYEMQKPGTVSSSLPASNQFGLIFGTDKTGSSNLIAETTNQFEGLPGITESIKSIYFGQDVSTPITLQAGNDNYQRAGTYKLNLAFTGAPDNAHAYVGYVLLNFQETTVVQDGNVTYTMPMNYIEVRVDMYVEPTGTPAEGTTYNIKVNMENDGNEYTGYSEVLFASIPMSEMILDSIVLEEDSTDKKLLPNTLVRVSAVMNQDNTSGWMSSYSVTIRGSELPSTGAVYNIGKSIGVESGSAAATIAYYVYYTDSAQENKDVVLNFTVKTSTEDIHYRVVLKLKERETVTLTFHKGDQDTVVEHPYKGSYLTLGDCPLTGKNFVGWYTDANFNTPFNFDVPLTSGLNLYARYMYTVTFNNMDGTSSKLYLPQEAGGASINTALMPSPTKNGYEFGGWYKNTDYLYKWDPTVDKVSEDVTLYAKWVGIEVKVNFLYLKDGQWETFKKQVQDNGYVVKYVDTNPVYLTVRIGSTFDFVDPGLEGNKVVLEYVQNHLPGDDNFIHWQIYTNNDPVNGSPSNLYTDTVLTVSMVDLSGYPTNTPEIKLYAVTSNVAIKVTMDKNTKDTSALVVSPSEFYPYPIGPVGLSEINGVWKDVYGTEYDKDADGYGTFYKVKNGGTVRYYPDGKGSYRCYDENVLEEFVVTVGEDDFTYYKDKYGNVWSYSNNSYSFVTSTVYVDNGGTIEAVEWNGTTQFPEGGFYMDKYGNRFSRSGPAPIPTMNDTYTLTLGLELYYSFTYVLNDATRPGYRLVYWNNDNLSDPLNPRPGSERDIKVFLDSDGYVDKSFLEVISSDGQHMVREITGYAQHTYRLDKTGSQYEIVYKAIWDQIEYNVSISGTENGFADAYLVNSDGTRTYLPEGMQSLHYGDIVEIIYTPSDYYKFNKWVVTGDCTIDNIWDSTTTVLITGDCSIIANDIGNRVVRLTMIFDNNKITDEELQKTEVLLHKKEINGSETGIYYEMELKSGLGTQNPKIYSNYIPLGTYEVCLRYNNEDRYYALYGDINVTIENTTEFTFYVISASIVDSITIKDGTGTRVETSTNTQAVLDYTRYVGALESKIFGQAQELVINNPDGHLPAVELTIAPGYTYKTFEGYVDTDGYFKVNTNDNMHENTDVTRTGNDVVKFYLNWIKYDEPASIIVQASKIDYTVTFKLNNADGTPFIYEGEQLSATVVVHQGEQYLSCIPASFYPKIGAGKSMGGWYFDQAMHVSVLGFNVVDVNDVIGGNMVIYGKVVDGVHKSVNVQVVSKNIYDDGVTMQAMSVFPLKKQDDGSFSGVYTIRNIAGQYVMMDNIVVPEGFSIQDIGNGQILITASSEAAWGSDPSVLPVFVLTYARYSATISIDSDYTSLVASGAWEPGKTAVWEEEVRLPSMLKNENGDSIIGWTASTDVEIINRGVGVYYYKVSADNTQKSITFTPVYPEKRVTVSFLTPFGEFSNGKQRMMVSVEYGHTVSEPGISGAGTAYTKTAFYDGDSVFSFNTPITTNKTLVANWSVVPYNFKCNYGDHVAVSSNITVPAKGDGSYDLGYGSEVILTISPEAGWDLDMELTKVVDGQNAVLDSKPVKVPNSRTYTWTFHMEKDLVVTIVTKVAYAKINFFVNGALLTTAEELNKVPVDSYPSGTSYTGEDIPTYTTVSFKNYDNKTLNWYTDPCLGSEYLLEKTGDKYILTMKEDISLYTYSGNYFIHYHDYDEKLLATQNENEEVGQDITLNQVPTSLPGHVFVGWAEENGYKNVYTYKPGQTFQITSSTPARIELHAFYLTDGNAVKIWTGSNLSSSIQNDLSVQIDPNMEVHYSDTTPLNHDNYSTASTTPTSFQGVGNHTVYYYCLLKDSGSNIIYEYGGSYVLTIIGNHLINFKNGTELIEQRRIIDTDHIGALPVLNDTQTARFDGWYIGETKVDPDTLGEDLEAETDIVAKWTPKYAVTFNTSGGSPEVPTQYIISGETATAPQGITKQASDQSFFTLVCWRVASGPNVGSEFNFNTPITSDISLMAQWSHPDAKTVSYYGMYSNQLTLVIIDSSLAGEPIGIEPVTPEIRGLTMLGWYEIELQEESPGYVIIGTEPFDFKNTIITKDIKLMTVWKVHSYNIHFDTNGGIGSVDDTTSVAQGPPTFFDDSGVSRNGYDLLGWSLIRNGDVSFTNKVSGPLPANDGDTVTLYAKWQIRTYHVTLDPKNTGQIINRDVNYGDLITSGGSIPVPEKEGYRFTGWYVGDVLFDIDHTPVTSDLSLTAGWAEKLTVTFHPNYTGAVDFYVQVDKGSSVGVPNDPVNGNNQFGGWCTKEVYHDVTKDVINYVAYDFSKPVNENLDLYAVWYGSSDVVVSFYSQQGGSNPKLATAVNLTERGDYKIDEPSPGYVPGMTFLGWFEFEFQDASPGYKLKQPVVRFNFDSPIDESHRLIVMWKIHEYNIHFDLNEGSGSIQDTTSVAYGPPTFINDSGVTREGYALMGWSTSPDGQVMFSNRIPISGPLSANDHDKVTLYAIWAKQYTIKFMVDGEEVYSETVYAGGKATKPEEDPTKDPSEDYVYFFGGWYNGSIMYDFDTPVTEDLTLDAVWDQRLGHIVSFYSSYGGQRPSVKNSVFIPQGNKVLEPETPEERGGLTFRGWYQFEFIDEPPGYRIIGDEPYDFNQEVDSNLLIIAHWTSYVYNIEFNVNGGSGSIPKTTSLAYGPPTYFDDSGVSKSGCDLLGWSLERNGPIKFSRGQPISGVLPAPDGGTVILYAVWSSPDPDPHHGGTTEKETEIIVNPDGSETRVEKTTTRYDDGSIRETIVETTRYNDGKTVVEKSTTFTEITGESSSESSKTVTYEDASGNSVKDESKESKDFDGSTRTEDSHSVKDGSGKLVDLEVEIIETDAEGKKSVLQIYGDADRVDVLMPDREYETLKEVKSVVEDERISDIVLNFESDDGILDLEANYIIKVSNEGYSISFKSRDLKVDLDEKVMDNLSSKFSDIELSITWIDVRTLPVEQREIIKDNHALSLKIDLGEHTLSELGGKATVRIAVDESYDHVYYVGTEGHVEEIECYYDHDSKMIVYSINHFSIYTITEGPLVYGGEAGFDFVLILIVLAILAVAVAIVYLVKR